MEKGTIQKVSRQVVRTFPEMDGVTPTVRSQSGADTDQYLLIYKGKAALPGGKSLTRIVRVVANERGQIVRISTSR
ncbi:MAG TPA: hypothetical protein VK449_04520 [Anaerolineales bacterium]|nr:hypothetical protein [Anaerolineales bacterium]